MNTCGPTTRSFTGLLTALADEQRQRVLAAFLDAGAWELSATEIADRGAPHSRPAVSHHQGILRRTGVLSSRREGKRIYYAINREYIVDSLLSFVTFVKQCCPDRRPCSPVDSETEVCP